MDARLFRGNSKYNFYLFIFAGIIIHVLELKASQSSRNKKPSKLF